jgi:hypothetical protein
MPTYTRTCPASAESFEISEADVALYARLGPTYQGKQYSIPLPTHSPRERARRRFALRNERHFYRGVSCISGKALISIYSPDKPFKVCSRDEALQIDNTSVGREFDFSRSFFSQCKELYDSTTKSAVVQSGEMLNSEYTHFTGWAKDCYMVFDAGQGQNMLYGVFMGYSKDVMDAFYLANCELCYECVKVDRCYNLHFGLRCQDCNFSAFLENCIGCSHCIGCCNLRNKEYYVFNEPVGKSGFEQAWNTLFNGSWAAFLDWRHKFELFSRSLPKRAVSHINCQHSTGDDLGNCENVRESFNVEQARNSAYLNDCYFGVEDCADISSWGESMSRSYELSGCGGLTGKSGMEGCAFSSYIYYGGYNVLYSINCIEKCQDLLGCFDLRKKQYCILNKQYSKDEYDALAAKIVEHMQHTGEWGEFFPLSFSSFGYNESIAAEYFPLTKEQALSRGAHWSDYQAPIPSPKDSVPPQTLPDNIQDVDDSYLQRAIGPTSSGRYFRMTRYELEFYRTHRLPLPREDFYARHLARAKRLNPRLLTQRTCAKTGVPIVSTYPSGSADIVYSVDAFRAYVYGEE